MKTQEKIIKEFEKFVVAYDQAGVLRSGAFVRDAKKFLLKALDQVEQKGKEETIKEIEKELKKNKIKIDQDGDLWGYTERFVNTVVLWKDIKKVFKKIK